MNFNFTTWAGLAALSAGVAGAWNQVKNCARYLIGIVFAQVLFRDGMGDAITSFCLQKSWKSPLGVRVFGAFESYIHPKRLSESVAFECISSDPILVRYKNGFGILSLSGNEEGVNVGTRTEGDLVKFRYFRWGFDLEGFAKEALEVYNDRKRRRTSDGSKPTGRFNVRRLAGLHADNHSPEPSGRKSSTSNATYHTDGASYYLERVNSGVYRLLAWAIDDLKVQPEGSTPFVGYPFPKAVSDGISEIDRWLSNEAWFRSKCIPWRLGWLLHGPPGTGKSTLIRIIGMHFDMPIYIFDLAGMSNADFVSSWDRAMADTPCLAVLEDIDGVFKGREYVGPQNNLRDHLTFDCLLNVTSGVKQADGVMIVVTTNHIEYLDPALGVPDETGRSSRPGRLDRAIKLGLMEPAERLVLAQHILSDCPAEIEEIVKLGEGETPAQFQTRCADKALSWFWKPATNGQ